MKFPCAIATCAALAGPAVAERFDCVIDPSFQLNLGSPVTGLLEDVFVSRGDRVQSGDAIARLSSDIEKVTVSLLSERAESDAAIANREARVRLAEQDYNRAEQLFNQNITSEQILQEREVALEIAQRELAEARVARRIAVLELKRAQATLDRRTITSPISGWIVERYLGPGEYVHQESQIVTVARLHPLHVETFVPVEHYGDFVLGMDATVFPGPPINGEFVAEVIVVDKVFDASSGTFGVRLVLPNLNGALPAGQRCTVEFELSADTAQQP